MKIWKGIAIVVALVLVNVLVHRVVVRWDMTNDHRYSIAPTTKALLQTLDAPLEITILLDGELNAGFQRLQRATVEMVEEMGAMVMGNGISRIDLKGSRISEAIYNVRLEDHLRCAAFRLRGRKLEAIVAITRVDKFKHIRAVLVSNGHCFGVCGCNKI